MGGLQYRILDGDSLGICWGRLSGALFFVIFNDFLISILICICTCSAYEMRIKGSRDCLDLYGVILLTKMKKKLRFPERKCKFLSLLAREKSLGFIQYTYITSKQIKLGSPGCSDFEVDSKSFKT